MTGLDNVVPTGSPLSQHLFQEVPKTLIQTSVDTALGGEKFGESLRSNILQSIGKIGSQKIGQNYRGHKPTLTYFTHKTAHGLLGALLGYATTGTKDGTLSGITGGIISEVVAEQIMGDVVEKTATIYENAARKGVTLTREEFHEQYERAIHLEFALNTGQMAAAFTSLLTGQNVEVSIQTAQNAITHNFIPAALVVGCLAYEAYDIYQTYTARGPEEALFKLGITATEVVVSGLVVRGAFVVGGRVFKSASAAFVHYKSLHPVFAKFYDTAKIACTQRGERVLNTLNTTVKTTTTRVTQLVKGLTPTLPLGAQKVKIPNLHYQKGIHKQGFPFEDYLTTTLPKGSRLPENFKTFDFYDRGSGLAVSAKTLDTTALSYVNNPTTIYNRLKGYVNKMNQFTQHELSGKKILPHMIQAKELHLGIPSNTSTLQWTQLQKAQNYATTHNIKLQIYVVN